MFELVKILWESTLDFTFTTGLGITVLMMY